ncbi:MAG: nucleotidyltransferase domain-containing protein [Nanoarchaeota archaeon]|nr:nucleotidyltransferase domain-containing protein [Nanoarchaeota archaeon]
MEFRTEYPKNPNLGKYPAEEYALARKFAEEMYKEFGKFIKVVALFGSTAKQKTKKADVDILVIVDDLMLRMEPEVVETYRIITEKLVAKISQKIHVTSMKFTSFWEYARAGDPVVVNILRDGIALIDYGFFDPMQALLGQGRIRPTPEAIWSYFARAPSTIHNSKWHVMQAVVDLYWAVIDSAHAVLMKMGEIPPSPDHVADMLEEKLVKRNLLDAKYVNTMREFYKLQKMVIHREIKEITGTQYDHYKREAEEFVKVMQDLVELE